MAFRTRAEVLTRFAGYSHDEIQNMDDISVFRRFFVVQNIISELISGITGRPMDERQTIDTTRYGEDPFINNTEEELNNFQQSSNNMSNRNNTQTNSEELYGFPS